ncbi:MAG: hypothetical protein A3K19_17640 [Lentisphaerae bacterium RIFOXYB12_FULL_65_16]|nr:MAG: hypothetical protein A3K18_28795 [Lentisphaerae bacterium RIFOXYA12_64_32]OGV90121.1 MAG: hypothetical protein A3K19_17640 [Lentisphaerae bacterium RIFOXYB12_FULL_65_16]
MKELAKECLVTTELAGRVDLVVRHLVSGVSRSQVRALIGRGCVTVNEQPCGSDHERVQPGDTVRVTYDPAQGYREAPPSRGPTGFQIVYEDEHLIVVDKPAHLLTVPTDKRDPHTLVHLVRDYVFRNQRGRVEIVHRLDRGVSGLLVFGKDVDTGQRLQNQFAARKPDREYLAVVAGDLPQDTGTFDTRLVTAKNLTRHSSHRDDEGEPAVTHYTVERRLNSATVVRVRLDTGRRNQIRVHFAEAGHPVLGDPRYAPELARHPRWNAKRLALHATRLGFAHPFSGNPLRFESAPPAEFAPFCRTRAGTTGAQP